MNARDSRRHEHVMGELGAGTLARDARSGRVGVVMDRVGPYVQLRPVGGGREWDVAPGNLQPVPCISPAEGA